MELLTFDIDHEEARRLRYYASAHRSPGHHVDGGSLAEILVVRSATKWLRLYGHSQR